jgi:hypothetical protein
MGYHSDTMNNLRLSMTMVMLPLLLPHMAAAQETVRPNADVLYASPLIVPIASAGGGVAGSPPADSLRGAGTRPAYSAFKPYLVVSQAAAPEPPGNRFQDFLDMAILSPGPYVLALGGGVIDEITGFPEEWTGGKGFGQRTLARVGSGFASDVTGHSLAAILNHRVRYEECVCSGMWNRTTHALAWGFVTRHDNGELVMHTSLFVAKFAAAGIANAWYPRSYTAGDVAREGSVGIGVNALLNIAREFAPELKRLIGIR